MGRWGPSNVAVVNNEEAIVSLWNTPELYIINIKDTHRYIKSKIETGYGAKSLAIYHDKIVIACFSEPDRGENHMSLKLIVREGKGLWSKVTNDAAYNVFQNIIGIVCFEENERHVVVVSDCMKERLVKLDFETGEVIQILDAKGKRVVGAAFDGNDILYVCDNDHNSIYAINKGLESIFTVADT